MTEVGTRQLFEVMQTRYDREKIVQALAGITVVAHGPPPTKVLREFLVPIRVMVPEPNTWREILQELDENPNGFTRSRAAAWRCRNTACPISPSSLRSGLVASRCDVPCTNGRPRGCSTAARSHPCAV